MIGVASLVIPAWGRLLAMMMCGAALWLAGNLHGTRVAGQAHLDYLGKQARASAVIARAQARVVIETQTVVQERVRKIYLKGAEIEKQVPVYVTAADDQQYGVNVGWVRQYNAAWSGQPASAAGDFDREPAGIPLSEIAQTEAHNAASCAAWREQVIGWREFYAGLQRATNQQGEP